MSQAEQQNMLIRAWGAQTEKLHYLLARECASSIVPKSTNNNVGY